MSKARKVLDNLWTYGLLIIVSAIFAFPCLWLVLASFSSSGSMYDYQGFFPPALSTASFVKLFTDTALHDYPRWFANTLYIAVASALISTVLVILTAYTMSRFEFRGRKAMMKLTLVLGMFPGFMGMIAIYIVLMQFGLVNRLEALIVVYSAGSSLGYMVQKGYFDTISRSIDEAARIDGANNATVFLRITMPLSRPMLVYTALTAFAWPWSDFILPKMILKDRSMWTVAVGLMNMDMTEFSRFAAGAVFISVPIIILFFCLIKNIVQGMSAGAVKG